MIRWIVLGLVYAQSLVGTTVESARTGSGAWTFEAVSGWGKGLAGPTHGGVVIDKKGNVYVSTDNEKGFHVFSPEGKLLRTMAAEFRGTHQLALNEEEGEEFIYGAHLWGRQIVKLKLDGTAVWTLGAPVESGHYKNKEHFNPTSVAVAPDGSIFVADGYGTSLIHKFDKDRKYVKSFGGADAGAGRLSTCHAIAIDSRGKTPMLLVCDRENRRLSHFDLDGNFVAVLATNLRRPSSIAFFGDFVAIAELEARIVILDKHHQIVSVLGDNPNRGQWANYGVPASAWKDAVFTAPHGLAFDREGNLHYQEWNETGKVGKLARAGLALASPFGDHMVLQRDRKVPVWGWATPGAAIAVKMADQETGAVAGKDGRWKAEIGPFRAGGPHDLVVSGAGTITLRDVLVGDVWVCSGQSNMEWPVHASANAADEIAAAKHPQIRLMTVQHAIAPTPRETFATTGWAACTPESVKGFSAVGYFFGREMHQRTGVPVGLINSSWGGTVCEAWTSAGALREIPDFKRSVERIEEALANPSELQKRYEKEIAAWQKRVRAMDPGTPEKGKGWWDPGVDVSKWKMIDLPSHWEMALGEFDGSVWYRRTVEIPEAWAGKELALTLGPIDDEDVTWFGGTRVGGLEGPGHHATPREYKVPASLVKKGPVAIVIRAYDTGGPGGFSGKPEQMKLSCGGESVSLAGAWSYHTGLDLHKIPPRPQPPGAVNGQNSPTALFNGMIAPLVPFGIQGAIWYQGESNAGRAKQYRTLFASMIRDWRAQWGQGDFHFLFVQLANFMAAKPEPAESAWAELREAQRMTLDLPNTGMAVAIDIGEAGDIHPKNKQDVGKRLVAAFAGKSGPLYRSMKVEEGKIRLSFDHAEGLVAKGGALKGFAVAGEGGKFVRAEATLDGETVVVWSEKVAKPVSVRYAWADNPAGCNLYDKEGLPASPFRTDVP